MKFEVTGPKAREDFNHISIDDLLGQKEYLRWLQKSRNIYCYSWEPAGKKAIIELYGVYAN